MTIQRRIRDSLRLAIVTVVTMASFYGSAKASISPPSARKNAFGFQIGAPTAIVALKRLDERRTLLAGVAYSFSDYISVHGDFLISLANPLASNPSPFMRAIRPYVGLGARLVNSRDSDTLTARIPIGAEWRSVESPLGTYLEIVPGLHVIPETRLALQGALGVRYEY